ncbi:MAG: chromosome segregation protein SMC [Candidatus Altiarchaeota archaeon]
MRLTRLELKGFKSFRDKTVLEFPDKFTGIVGPNGSGKSNITEAICFVLGKSRGLRAANLQELIFNGGIGGSPAPKAVVAITLEDDGGVKHRIMRIADRDGSSVYKLDDKRVTRQQILDLAGDNEYNIILQDDITKVLEMKPKDRRKVIDDLCGIGVYDEKRDKALRELEKVEERIGQTHIILGEKQGYMQELKKERDEALNYTKVRDELRASKATLLYKDINSMERREEKIDEETEKLKKSREDNLVKIADTKSDIQKRTLRLKEISSGIIRLEEEKRGTRIAETKGEILRFEDRMKLQTEKLEGILSEERDNSMGLDVISRQEKEMTAGLSGFETKHHDMMREIESESKRGVDITLENEVDEVKNKIYEARSTIRALKEVNAKKTLEKTTLEKERDEFESRIKGFSGEEQNRIKDVEKLALEYEKSVSDVRQYESEHNRMDKEVSDAQQRLEEERILLSKKQSEIQTIMRTSGGLQQAVKATLGLKKVIPGIHGPVMQLGEVADSRYNTALQVAAGGRMQHVVVESVNDAAKCIEYLRQKKIGRCTFLPLDKINYKAEGKPPKEAIGFARDFIKYSKKFSKVFEYVFGDTIIVKDIEVAKSIGVGEWRMVTLDGDLLELSGAMTGGHMPERFEITFSNVDELEKEMANVEGRVQKLAVEYDEQVKARGKLESTLATLRERLKRNKDALDATSLEKNIATERRTGMRDRLNRVVESLSSLEKEIQDNAVEATKLEKNVGADEKKLKDLAERRQGGKTPKIESLKDSLREVEVEKTKLEEKLAYMRQQAATYKARMRELAPVKDSLGSEIKTLQDNIRKLKIGLEDLEKAHQSVDGEIQKLADERTNVEENITELSTRIGEIEHGMEASNQEMNEFIIEKAKISTRLEDLRREYAKYEGVQLIEKSVKDLTDAAEKLEQQLTSFGSVNMRAIETFEVIKKEFEEITNKLETLKKERQSIFDFMDKIEGKKRETFMEAFEKVKAHFERIYTQLADGKGTLTLDNPMNISESGLMITASPGGKRLMSLDAMSGGEKVLTSTAFLLGIQQYKPAYFYVVDELDAALDKKNSVKLAEMLAKSSSQFLMVTHNNNMLKYMDSAIGVSMVQGVSQIVGVRFDGGPVPAAEATRDNGGIEGEEATDNTGKAA